MFSPPGINEVGLIHSVAMTVSFHTWTSPPLLQLLPCSGPHVVVLKWARRPRRRVPVSHTVPALAAAAPRTAVGLMLSNSPQLGFTLCLPACFGFNDFIAFQVSHPSLLTINSLKVISNPIYKSATSDHVCEIHFM